MKIKTKRYNKIKRLEETIKLKNELLIGCHIHVKTLSKEIDRLLGINEAITYQNDEYEQELHTANKMVEEYDETLNICRNKLKNSENKLKDKEVEYYERIWNDKAERNLKDLYNLLEQKDVKINDLETAMKQHLNSLYGERQKTNDCIKLKELQEELRKLNKDVEVYRKLFKEECDKSFELLEENNEIEKNLLYETRKGIEYIEKINFQENLIKELQELNGALQLKIGEKSKKCNECSKLKNQENTINELRKNCAVIIKSRDKYSLNLYHEREAHAETKKKIEELIKKYES